MVEMVEKGHSGHRLRIFEHRTTKAQILVNIGSYESLDCQRAVGKIESMDEYLGAALMQIYTKRRIIQTQK